MSAMSPMQSGGRWTRPWTGITGSCCVHPTSPPPNLVSRWSAGSPRRYQCETHMPSSTNPTAPCSTLLLPPGFLVGSRSANGPPAAGHAALGGRRRRPPICRPSPYHVNSGSKLKCCDAGRGRFRGRLSAGKCLRSSPRSGTLLARSAPLRPGCVLVEVDGLQRITGQSRVRLATWTAAPGRGQGGERVPFRGGPRGKDHDGLTLLGTRRHYLKQVRHLHAHKVDRTAWSPLGGRLAATPAACQDHRDLTKGAGGVSPRPPVGHSTAEHGTGVDVCALIYIGAC